MENPVYLVGALAVGALAGYVFGTKDGERRLRGGPTLAEKKKDPNSQIAFVVRTDLGMSKGKAAAQVSHAMLAIYEKAVRRALLVSQWRQEGEQKVVLGISGEEELLVLQAKAESLGLTTEVIQDAGRTQIDPGSLTVLAIGPAGISDVEKLTRDLKLF